MPPPSEDRLAKYHPGKHELGGDELKTGVSRENIAIIRYVYGKPPMLFDDVETTVVARFAVFCVLLLLSIHVFQDATHTRFECFVNVRSRLCASSMR